MGSGEVEEVGGEMLAAGAVLGRRGEPTDGRDRIGLHESRWRPLSHV